MQDFSPVSHVKNVHRSNEQVSPFYAKLMRTDERIINIKIEELINHIQDVHQMKIFYTLVRYARRMNEINEHDHINYIRQGLEKAALTTINEDAFIIFKIILDKAIEDQIINIHWYRRLDRRAELKNTEHAPFIKELQQAVKNNTARIEGLEANVTAINDSLNKLKKGLKHKMVAERRVAFMSLILNAVSCGALGPVLQGVMSTTIEQIVDFGDAVHIEKVALSLNDTAVLESVEEGKGLGQYIADISVNDVIDFTIDGYGMTADRNLEKAVNDVNLLTVITAAAIALPLSNPQPSVATLPAVIIAADLGYPHVPP